MDAERVDRFAELAGQMAPWPLVFSADEAEHHRGLADPAAGLCASFCCKEALLKAVGQPYDLRECELLYDPIALRQSVRVSTELRREFDFDHAWARIIRVADVELVAALFLFGPS